MHQINNKGNWVALKEKIRLAYPIITKADLKLKDGDDFDLLVRLQNKFSKTKKEIIVMIDKV
jgi:hypothetical protein